MRPDLHTRPFGFDRIFTSASQAGVHREDLERQLGAARAEIAELAAARAAALATAREDGFAAGLAQARAEIAEALTRATAALEAGLLGLGERLAMAEAQIVAEAAEAALAAAELIAARTIGADPAAPIEAAIGRVVAQLGRRVAIAVRVHPTLVDALRLRLATPAVPGQRPQLYIEGDAQLPPGDVAVEWDGGGLALDRADRLAAVATALGLGACAAVGTGFCADIEDKFRGRHQLAETPGL